MTIQEKVARALCTELKFDPDIILDGPTFAGLVNEPFWKTYQPAAEAALEAVIEHLRENKMERIK